MACDGIALSLFCLLAFRYTHDVGLHHAWPLILAKSRQHGSTRFTRDHYPPLVNQRRQHPVQVSTPGPFSPEPSAKSTQPRRFGKALSIFTVFFEVHKFISVLLHF